MGDTPNLAFTWRSVMMAMVCLPSLICVLILVLKKVETLPHTFIRFILTLLITFFSQNLVAASAAESLLTPQQVTRDVNLLKSAYSRIHPGYTRYTDETVLNNAWANIVQKAEQQRGISVGDFYLAVQQTLSLVRCDHTKANLPKAMKQERETSPVYLPFRWVWVDNKAFVTQVDEANKLNKFDQIISIDNKSIQSLVEQVKPFIPYDGYTEWSRNGGIAESLEFAGGALDHFGALLWDVQKSVELGVRTANGENRIVTLERINFKQWSALISQSKTAGNFKDAVSFTPIGDNIAYLKIDTFVNYRQPVDPDDIYNPVFKTIKDQKRGVLILDMRNNGGGSTDASQGLLANLISQKMQYKTDMFAKTLSFEDIKQHLWTWEESALSPSRFAFSKNDNGTYSLRSWFTDDLDTVKPAKYAFTGKIIALISNSNSSGSTDLLSVIHSLGNTQLVGEKTGGSSEGPTAGLLFTLTLPESNITTRVPFFQYKNNVKAFTKGMGLNPDVFAPMTENALITDQDPSLEVAIEMATAFKLN